MLTDGLDAIRIPPRDMEAVEAALKAIVDDPKLRRRLAEAAGRAFAEGGYGPGDGAQRLLSYYEDALGGVRWRGRAGREPEAPLRVTFANGAAPRSYPSRRSTESW